MSLRRPSRLPVRGRGITLRQVAPNAVTAMALCFGLTGMRYAMSMEWERAVVAIVLAAVLDGIDGRIARMLHGESRFGAELDSLSDVIAFGVSPAIILYLWSLQAMPRFGWIGALGLALCCALRLARFNAQINVADQPLKLAGFNLGVPAPGGAGLAFLPIFIWFSTGWETARDWRVVLPWTIVVAFLMVSNLPTMGWKRLRVPPSLRLFAIGAAGIIAALLFATPWPVLLALSLTYLALLPIAWLSYARITRQRARVRDGVA
ncbi:MAG TPA: phosphatidylcholine/phosphatidylserine synthase [Sphingobium sp.]